MTKGGERPVMDAIEYRSPGLTATDDRACDHAAASKFNPPSTRISMTEPVLLSRDDAGIRVLTINRPEKLNALDSATIASLQDAFDAAALDPGVRCIVLTGAGPKAFVAGADIAQMAELSAVQAQAFSARGQRLMRDIERFAKPVVAMVNGFALGGGLELAMACHLRIASSSARLGQPEINLGLVPGFGGTQRLLRLAGRSATLELCLLGAPIDAQRAHQLGLVTQVVDAADLEATTMTIARQLCGSAPLAMQAVLDCILVGGECAIDQGLAYETAQFGLMFSTDDMREGTAAFLARRKAAFKGT